MPKYTNDDLTEMQAWPLERKIRVTQTRIIEWYQHYDGNVYVSFSGGKDSTVLLDLARRIYPDIEAVFVDTGLEYPEIKQFVKSKESVTILRPKMVFDEVVRKYGYPIISKSTAQCIREAKPGNIRWKRLNGELKISDGSPSLYNCKKWKYLMDEDFKISEQCCQIMKKTPFKLYEKRENKKPITGVMADES
ncbi:MAG: phosphoadenosine phosphosulfate reductase family protein, partial [Eubacterium sp.]